MRASAAPSRSRSVADATTRRRRSRGGHRSEQSRSEARLGAGAGPAPDLHRRPFLARSRFWAFPCQPYRISVLHRPVRTGPGRPGLIHLRLRDGQTLQPGPDVAMGWSPLRPEQLIGHALDRRSRDRAGVHIELTLVRSVHTGPPATVGPSEGIPPITHEHVGARPPTRPGDTGAILRTGGWSEGVPTHGPPDTPNIQVPGPAWRAARLSRAAATARKRARTPPQYARTPARLTWPSWEFVNNHHGVRPAVLGRSAPPRLRCRSSTSPAFRARVAPEPGRRGGDAARLRGGFAQGKATPRRAGSTPCQRAALASRRTARRSPAGRALADEKVAKVRSPSSSVCTPGLPPSTALLSAAIAPRRLRPVRTESGPGRASGPSRSPRHGLRAQKWFPASLHDMPLSQVIVVPPLRAYVAGG